MQPINWKYSNSSSKCTHFCPWTAWTERFSTPVCQGHRSKLLTLLQGHVTSWITHIQSSVCCHQFQCGRGSLHPAVPWELRHVDEFVWDPVGPVLKQPPEDKGEVPVLVNCVFPVLVWRLWFWSCRASWNKNLTCCPHSMGMYKLYVETPAFLSHWLA